MPNDKFPKDVIVKVSEKGLMDNDMMNERITGCFVKRPDGFFRHNRAILIMDTMRAHITDDVKDASDGINISPAIIPGVIATLFQPLDISVNRTFKMHEKT